MSRRSWSNEDFNDDLDNIPINIKILGIYTKTFKLQHLPQHIKWLNLFDLNNHFIIPNTLDILYISHIYLTKFPDILLTITYGIKVLILEVIQNDLSEINLDYLPDTIEYIILVFEYCNIKDYIFEDIPETNPPNTYGNYIGSAQNHQYVIQNVVDVLNESKKIKTNALEGLKVTEIIENIYKGNKI